MRYTLALTATLALALAALAPLAADPPPPPPSVSTAPATRPADVRDEATADEVIRELLRDRPKIPVLPSTATTTAPASRPTIVAPKSVLRPLPMPPGAMIVNRLGRLVKAPGEAWWAFHFESEKNVLYEAPIRILPNRLLEEMEDLSAGGTKPGVRFRISGEVTEYRGRRYLLLRRMLLKREFTSR